MRREAVDSSSLRRVGYCEDGAELEVEFASGACYRYAGVPPEVHRALLAAPSKGTWFNREFKSFGFAYERLAD